ncbi:hypothetical protein QN277_011102 [Acacia crassicarpa]|uniref:Uncharacterized protein n=1 Tax=Acacia crassicarpa TaxID=499986 RepID=A0AAE1TBP1_9FABA|nr:hypothetical protein QN277_011102 [Acacia crassicarpa]
MLRRFVICVVQISPKALAVRAINWCESASHFLKLCEEEENHFPPKNERVYAERENERTTYHSGRWRRR